MELIERNIIKLRDLCTQYNVLQLYAFGSILTGNFKDDSDIDFLVSFGEIELINYADNYFGLKFSLEDLLNRKIDLLEDKAIKNPFLRESIDSSKRLIYE
jgi:hypothetical protein